MDIKEEAYEEAIRVLERCSTKNGFYAAYPGYDMVFARDSMIISLGASLIDDKFKKVIESSLTTLGNYQSKKGQIPNAVDKFSKREGHVDYKSIDSTLWWVIGNYLFKERYGGDYMIRNNKDKIKKAVEWLSYQDMGEDGLLEQQPTTDWQDALPHRYGHTINTQALWYKVLSLIGDKGKASKVKEVVNNSKDDGLWNGKFYDSYRWKNHNKYKEVSDWFDSLGNFLAILYGLSDNFQSNNILDYVRKNKINRPYPVKAIYPPISQKSKYWQDYFLDAGATENKYLNGGIWTFIGGFYVCALVKRGRLKEAEKELNLLAEANLLAPKYSEWMDGLSGRPGQAGSGSKEGNQGWNAGMFVVAYESVKRKKCLI